MVSDHRLVQSWCVHQIKLLDLLAYWSSISVFSVCVCELCPFRKWIKCQLTIKPIQYPHCHLNIQCEIRNYHSKYPWTNIFLNLYSKRVKNKPKKNNSMPIVIRSQTFYFALFDDLRTSPQSNWKWAVLSGNLRIEWRIKKETRAKTILFRWMYRS